MMLVNWFKRKFFDLIAYFTRSAPEHLTVVENLADRLSDDPIRNGIHAEQLLNDPLLKACFEQVRRSYLRSFEQTKIGDIEMMKIVQLRLAALSDVRKELLAFRFNGQTASAQAKQHNIPHRTRSFSSHK